MPVIKIDTAEVLTGSELTRTQNHESKTKMEDHTHFERQNILFIQLEEHLVLGNSKRTSKSI